MVGTPLIAAGHYASKFNATRVVINKRALKANLFLESSTANEIKNLSRALHVDELLVSLRLQLVFSFKRL